MPDRFGAIGDAVAKEFGSTSFGDDASQLAWEAEAIRRGPRVRPEYEILTKTGFPGISIGKFTGEQVGPGMPIAGASVLLVDNGTDIDSVWSALRASGATKVTGMSQNKDGSGYVVLFTRAFSY